jgi:prepilin-type N-terminal cleavage/methylation domain-containing protein
MNKSEKGFTLIELLVVLALVAILSVVVILTLNPAELLKQARDSNRTSDLSTLKSAISLYMADVNTPTLGAAGWCIASAVAASSTACTPFASTTGMVASTTQAGVRNVNGTGWVPVNFSGISSGAPIGQLPVDPVNNAQYYYAYGVTGTTNQLFELDAQMESTKYGSLTGGANVTNTDGGNQATWFETGTTLAL